VERAAPERAEIFAENVVHAAHHFAGSLVGEGEEEDALGRDALLQEECNAVSERARFARAGAGDDEGWSRRGGDGGVLLFIQLASVVDLKLDRLLKWMQDVLARHDWRESTRRAAEGKLWD
jgi:hypothetical protein